MTEVYILSACRTALGSFGGSLSGIPAVKLGEIVIQEAVKRAGIPAGLIDEVIMGNALQAGLGQNPARQASVNAGIPIETPSFTVNKVCGSGLAAVNMAVQAIKAGDAQCIVSGGMEAMSSAPYILRSHRWGARMGNGEITDEMIFSGLSDAFAGYHMGITAENISEKYGLSREELDMFAYSSQMKATRAKKSGMFKAEIVPVAVPQKKGGFLFFSEDEFIREDTTLERLNRLKPAFKADGKVTAGNSSGINDGAAAVIVATKKFVEEQGLKPMAKVLAYGSKGVEPSVMGLGPIPSVRLALKKARLKMEDIGLVEANEAFASQTLAVARELNFNMDKVNVNGGAIALGHPIGASGTRILVTLLHEMSRRKEKYGLATLCIGGGMGEATIVEMDELCMK